LEDGSRLTNLEALMADYGVTAAEGVVIEGDGDYYAMSAPYYLLPSLGDHTITEPLSEGGYHVLLPIAQGLTVSDSLPDDVSVTELLTTSNSAFSKIAGYQLTTYEKEDGDIDGPFALAVAVTQTLDEGESRIVWVTSSALVDDTTNTRVSGGNQDFFLNALGWMCEHEESISIHAKSMNREYLTMSSSTAALMTLIVVIVLPLVYLVLGIRTWVRRKRR
jgi:ABC-2 type transport system permease protein